MFYRQLVTHFLSVIIAFFNGYHLLSANHTIAAIKGTESYTLLESLTYVIADVNDLINNPTLDGISLKVVLGGTHLEVLYHNNVDTNNLKPIRSLQFLLLSMGMNEAHSIYVCGVRYQLMTGMPDAQLAK